LQPILSLLYDIVLLGDIALLKTYGIGPYTNAIKAVEDDIKKHQEKVKELIGIKESDTGKY